MARHNEKGKLGEDIAREYLVQKGYSIMEINWRSGRSEVDIIARMGNIVAFVEVKTRDSEFFGTPESFVTNKKINQLAMGVEAYCEMYPDDKRNVRYDIISVILNEKEQTVLHIEDAFFPDNLGLKY